MSTQTHFDAHQFDGRAHQQHPIHTEFVGGTIHSTGISYDDYTRMQTQKKKLFAGRRFPAPVWALNDAQLRAVVVRCVECRAYQKGAHKLTSGGTDAERLAQAKQKLAARKQNQIDQCVRMLNVHRLVKSKCGDGPARKIARKVEEADTQIITSEKIDLILLGCAYRYWRLGEKSTEVGAALGIKPPLVRKLCLQMRCAAGVLGYGPRLKLARARKRLGIDRRRKKIKRSNTETNLIPALARLPYVIKMHALGYSAGQIRLGLGWSAGSRDGYGMVKRLMIEAGLR